MRTVITESSAAETQADRLRADARRPSKPTVAVEKSATSRPRVIKLLMDLRPEAQKGPGPSKIAYRMTRIWKKAWVRRVALVIVPCALVAVLGWRLAISPMVHDAVADGRAAMVDTLSEMPEFAIRGLVVAGASTGLSHDVRAAVALPPGASTLTFDLNAARERVAEIAAVRQAQVKVSADGMLHVDVIERRRAALWRDAEGALWLADREGVVIGDAGARDAHPGLPIILGDGATAAMGEALSLFEAVPDLRPRIRALIRVGERRWNVVLDRNLTIMLPEAKPRNALSRVMAWHYAEELLDRSIVHIDMRVSGRPTVRMTDEAVDRYKLQKATQTGEGEDT